MADKVQAENGASDEKRSPRKRARPVKVRVIHQDGHAVLVEWQDKGTLHRAVVPKDTVKLGKVDKSELEAGHSYGDDFTAVEGVGPELVHELKRIGVWVKADILTHNTKIKNAIQQAYVVPLYGALLEYAQEE